MVVGSSIGSDFQDFTLFLLQNVLNFLHVLIRQFLDLSFGLPQFIFRQLGVFLQLFQLFVPVAAKSTNLDFHLFPVLLTDLDELFPPFLREGGEGNSESASRHSTV